MGMLLRRRPSISGHPVVDPNYEKAAKEFAEQEKAKAESEGTEKPQSPKGRRRKSE